MGRYSARISVGEDVLSMKGIRHRCSQGSDRSIEYQLLLGGFADHSLLYYRSVRVHVMPVLLLLQCRSLDGPKLASSQALGQPQLS